MTDSQKHIIGLVMYPGMTALDIVGPQQVLSALPNIQMYRIWKTLDPIRTDDGMVILPDTTFENCPQLDVICIGGGLGQMAVVDDPEVRGSPQEHESDACEAAEQYPRATRHSRFLHGPEVLQGG